MDLLDEMRSELCGVKDLANHPKNKESVQLDCLRNFQRSVALNLYGDALLEALCANNCEIPLVLIGLVEYRPYASVAKFSSQVLADALVEKPRTGSSSKGRNMALSALARNNVWRTLYALLDNLPSSIMPTAALNILLVIRAMAAKDSCIYQRMCEPKTIARLMSYLVSNSRTLFIPVLSILRGIVKNREAVHLLAKKEVLNVLETIYSSYSVLKSPKMKLIPIIVKQLSKYKVTHQSIMDSRIVPTLLQTLSSRNIPVTNPVIRNIMVIFYRLSKNDRMLTRLGSAETLSGILEFCSRCPDNFKDIVLLKACSIAHACMEKTALPMSVDSYSKFPLPLPISVADDGFTSDDSNDDPLSGDYQGSDEEDEEADESLTYKPDDFREDESELETDVETESVYRMSSDTEEVEWNNTLGALAMYGYLYAEFYPLNYSKKSFKIFQDLPECHNRFVDYKILATRVRSSNPIVKVAYPDMVFAEASGEHFWSPTTLRPSRSKMLEVLQEALNHNQTFDKSVYDLETLQYSTSLLVGNELPCNDIADEIKAHKLSTSLVFESRFESGNLRGAYKTGDYEYVLLLTSDTNSRTKHQWFYFSVSNMEKSQPYTFKIINCEKPSSQFNFGMQPLMFSVKESRRGRNSRCGWTRTGYNVGYYRNNYKDGFSSEVYHTLMFTVEFPYNRDICYLAYHYPYTYTRLMSILHRIQEDPPNYLYCRIEPLCMTLAGNEVPLVTITAPLKSRNPIQNRNIIVFTSRVHPGETCASWAAEGTLRALLQDNPAVASLRERFVFKFIPMHNPDGVIHGNYRYGLTSQDLNRCWLKPNRILHPEIFWAKSLIQYARFYLKKEIALYIDFHGHSRKKNAFLYGCSGKKSWKESDRSMQDNNNHLVYPTILDQIAGTFKLKSCKFKVEKARESTARVCIWREMAVKNSFTLECSYCGMDVGPYKNHQMNTKHLLELGGHICEALSVMTRKPCQ